MDIILILFLFGIVSFIIYLINKKASFIRRNDYDKQFFYYIIMKIIFLFFFIVFHNYSFNRDSLIDLVILNPYEEQRIL